jgi:long-subunit fatty acid transport protein
MDNVWFYGLYGGYKPIPKLDIRAGVYYAYADEEPTSNGLSPSPTNPRFVDRVYGTEFDLTAKYKIYDNLEYMVGFAYLWTGDYFQGTSKSNKVDNDYMVTHKLTLNF